MEVAGANRRWRCQFRYRGSLHESAVAQLFSLGGIAMHNSNTTHQGKAAHWAQTVLLVPSVMVLTLLLLRWASPTAHVPAWSRTFFLFSPILVIYCLGILFIFARRRVPLWIKTVEIAIIISSLLPLIGVAWFAIQMLCGVDVLPAD